MFYGEVKKYLIIIGSKTVANATKNCRGDFPHFYRELQGDFPHFYRE